VIEMKISFCILNYFEDWLCCRAIAQVYNYVDEILIGDCSREKDFLPKLIKGLPKCKIVPDPGFDAEGENFSWAKWRNYVQSFATGSWILWQDADEIYPLNMMKHLKKWLKETKVEAIGLIRAAHRTHKRREILNKEPKIRIWKNLNRIKWKGEIHECPKGFKTYEVWDIMYPHDIAWLPSFAQRIYKLKKRERRENILDRIKEKDLDPYRDLYPDKKEKEAFESRE